VKYLFEFESFNEGIAGLFKSAADNLTKENPEGANKGEMVDKMLTKTGASPGDPWCAAYVYSVFSEAGLPKEILNKIPKTPSVKQLWEKSTNAKKITKEDALNNPGLIKPGMVFCYLTKNSKGGHGPAGHTGIVVVNHQNEKAWSGFEGNANPIDGSREGYGTFYIKRGIADPSISKDPKERPALLLGFIDYLDGYRQGKDYDEFKKNLNLAASKYSEFTKNEIQRLKSNPKLADEHAKNYANR
jgi:hypothetical protein